ncbi:MbtH family protein [Nonomuraea sp. NPDC003707]
MTNPFERPTAKYLVLRNDRNQHSLWPSWIPVPPGWSVVHEAASKESCLRYIGRHDASAPADGETPR